MKKNTYKMYKKVVLIIKRNWFAITLVLIVFYDFFRKDLSFAVSLNSPKKVEKQNHQNKKKLKTLIGLNFLDKNIKRNLYSELMQLENKTIINYINRFYKTSKIESSKYGIPSQLILANAILMSRAGTNKIAKEKFNQFGIKCSKEPSLKGIKQMNYCFKTYDNAWLSFRDFSLLCQQSKNENNNLTLNNWIILLEKEFYADIKNYRKNILKIIQQYKLAFQAV